MRKAILIVPIVLFLLTGPALAGDDLPGILKGIQGKYGHLPGLTISYTREVITRSMSMLGNQVTGDLAKGTIYFKPPYFLRLEQKSPQPETIITDGEILWWYIPEKKQAYKYPFNEFGKELKLLSDIFRGLSRAEENFKIEMGPKTEEGLYRVQLTPDPPWQEINRIILSVTKAHEIKEVNIQNQLGSTTRFGLDSLTARDKFEKGLFQFTVPEGVKVIEEIEK